MKTSLQIPTSHFKALYHFLPKFTEQAARETHCISIQPSKGRMVATDGHVLSMLKIDKLDQPDLKIPMDVCKELTRVKEASLLTVETDPVRIFSDNRVWHFQPYECKHLDYGRVMPDLSTLTNSDMTEHPVNPAYWTAVNNALSEYSGRTKRYAGFVSYFSKMKQVHVIIAPPSFIALVKPLNADMCAANEGSKEPFNWIY